MMVRMTLKIFEQQIMWVCIWWSEIQKRFLVVSCIECASSEFWPRTIINIPIDNATWWPVPVCYMLHDLFQKSIGTFAGWCRYVGTLPSYIGIHTYLAGYLSFAWSLGIQTPYSVLRQFMDGQTLIWNVCWS